MTYHMCCVDGIFHGGYGGDSVGQLFQDHPCTVYSC